jgi:Helix-turn-helix domain
MHKKYQRYAVLHEIEQSSLLNGPGDLLASDSRQPDPERTSRLRPKPEPAQPPDQPERHTAEIYHPPPQREPQGRRQDVRRLPDHIAAREIPVGPEVAAAFLCVARSTVLAMARKGLIPAHPISGGGKRTRWRFFMSELERHVRSADVINFSRHLRAQ